jgi:hypothetical protein
LPLLEVDAGIFPETFFPVVVLLMVLMSSLSGIAFVRTIAYYAKL